MAGLTFINSGIAGLTDPWYDGAMRGGRALACNAPQTFALSSRLSCIMSPVTYLDPQLFANCLNVLVITLENADGNAWNSLRRDIEAIYKAASPDSYMPLATACCIDYATSWFWQAFPERDSFKTQWLIANRSKLIAAAAVAIADSERKEFDLGNFAA